MFWILGYEKKNESLEQFKNLSFLAMISDED